MVDSFCGRRRDEELGRWTSDIGVLNDLFRWIELVIFPLVMVVQRDEEIFIARFKCAKRLPCWYNALELRNCRWQRWHQNWFGMTCDRSVFGFYSTNSNEWWDLLWKILTKFMVSDGLIISNILKKKIFIFRNYVFYLSDKKTRAKGK